MAPFFLFCLCTSPQCILITQPRFDWSDHLKFFQQVLHCLFRKIYIYSRFYTYSPFSQAPNKLNLRIVLILGWKSFIINNCLKSRSHVSTVATFRCCLLVLYVSLFGLLSSNQLTVTSLVPLAGLHAHVITLPPLFWQVMWYGFRITSCFSPCSHFSLPIILV